MPARAAIHRALFERRHTTLLVAIVVAFAVRPVLGDAGLGPLFFSLALVTLLLVALYAVQLDELVGDREALRVQRRRRRMIAWVLAVPAIFERLLVLVAPSPRLYLLGGLCWFAFFAWVTWLELRSVLEQRAVTGETISMAIAVYLLMGLTWGMLYLVLVQVNPESFSIAHATASQATPQDFASLAPILVYFSLTTLSTVGFGDITPLTLQARYAAVAEGIAGQLYLTILVARLVSLRLPGSSGPT